MPENAPKRFRLGAPSFVQRVDVHSVHDLAAGSDGEASDLDAVEEGLEEGDVELEVSDEDEDRPGLDPDKFTEPSAGAFSFPASTLKPTHAQLLRTWVQQRPSHCNKPASKPPSTNRSKMSSPPIDLPACCTSHAHEYAMQSHSRMHCLVKMLAGLLNRQMYRKSIGCRSSAFETSPFPRTTDLSHAKTFMIPSAPALARKGRFG